MNDLQRTEWKLLKCFAEVCGKLDLKFFLVCGSALGAVKYQGFIPWDDDIDVAMYREDYELFLEKAPEMLPEGLFLQNYRTDPAFPQIYSKLRDSNTTYIETSAAALPINHGVFIDIFPLDGYPESPAEQRILEFRKKAYQSVLSCAYSGQRSRKGSILKKLCVAMGLTRHTDRIAAQYDRMVSGYPIEGSKMVCNHGNWQGKLDYSPAEHFALGADVEFEGIKVRVPAEYDHYLSRKYGDYMADLPAEQQVGHHYYQVCDCGRSYTDYWPLEEDG